MSNPQWLEHLQELIGRFSSIGIDADIASLSLIEAWGLYCYLMRLAEG